jgi:alcohol dehydrogenase, propanol-preferring
MLSMVLERPGAPLRERTSPTPEPAPGQVLIRVLACAVCRTDLHVVDGELPDPKLPLVPGHEVVGTIVGGTGLAVGERVGVPWLGWTCGACRFCRTGRENLCPNARFTGYTLDGGYAEYVVADARYCHLLPEGSAEAQAPLLCAGLIGFRALAMAGDAERVGLFGFGASAHLLAQVLVRQGRRAYAFTRPGDAEAQRLARELGCVWAGGSEEAPPELLDAALLFAPVGAIVPRALAELEPGGVVVCAGIHMSDIPAFPYSLLWKERIVRSVANLTREDGRRFFELVRTHPVRATTRAWPLRLANEALAALRSGAVTGAAVLVPER